jgi:hypothetical protein
MARLFIFALLIVGASARQPLDLGRSGKFAILSKTGITNVPTSAVSGGNVGSSPMTGAAILITCTEVANTDDTIYSVDVHGPPCATTDATLLGLAIGDMADAYTTAAAIQPANGELFVSELGGGSIGGKTLNAGVYKWSSSVLVATALTIEGDANDVFIFQIAGNLVVSSAVQVTLQGGAQAKNIFWQVAGSVTLGTTSHFEGTVLTATMVAMNTGSSINGRLLAQTAVTLQSATIKLEQ